MAIEQFINTGPKLQAQEVEQLKKLFGAELPEDYRQFLLNANGGRPHPSYFKSLPIKRLYSIQPNPDGFDLLTICEEECEYLPDGVIPIGCTDLGDQICLALKGKFRGKLFFWDHEGPLPGDVDEESEVAVRIREELGLPKPKPDDWPGYPALSLLADSFTEFLDGFYHRSDEELFGAIAENKVNNNGSNDADADG